MEKVINGYEVVEVGALSELGLVKIVNTITGRSVGTCQKAQADKLRQEMAPAVDDTVVLPAPQKSSKSKAKKVAEDTGAVAEKSATTPAEKPASTSAGVPAGTPVETPVGAVVDSSATSSVVAQTQIQTEKPKKASSKSKKNAETPGPELLSDLITALAAEYQSSGSDTAWRVPVEVCVSERGMVRNSLCNPADHKKRTFSDEEIAMLVFTPDGEVHLRKEYEHSDGSIATVDADGLNFTFDLDKVREAESNNTFPLRLLRKGGKLTTAWHIQDPATFADKSKALVYDLETTGVKNKPTDPDPEILQLTIMDFNGNAVLNEYFKPEYTTDWSGAAAVNGITPERVEGCATFRESLPRIQKIFDSATLIVGYNSNNFDDKVLTAQGVVFNDAPHYDVMLHYQKVFGMHGMTWCGKGNTYLMQKLTLAYLECIGNREGAKETVLGAHDALNDTRMTLEIFYALQTDKLVRDTPHWISLFFRDAVRNKDKALGTQDEAAKIWTTMFYQDPVERVKAMKEWAGKKCFPAIPKVYDLAAYCK